ncbi:MAG: lasso peptide biosynthesis B2 protein [Actinobacteria bacterium]|nr:lasso peptide biosynthesis B2 protein [Actinomycetota bacterium]
MRVKGLPSARAMWWARRAARQVRTDLDGGGLEQLVVPPPPPLPRGCRRWVAAVLRSRGDTCLVRSAVLQAWDAAHGRPRDLIIGVTAPRDGFKAHAWLEGDPAEASAGYTEVSRRVPPGAPPAADSPGRSGGGSGHELLDEPRKIVPRP